MVREAGGMVSCVDGASDPLKTGHVVCGNEFVHNELVKIIKSLGN
jgi:myo-inositol-1(or 4)-monophosphatase